MNAGFLNHQPYDDHIDDLPLFIGVLGMSPKDFLPDNFGSLSGEVPQHELRLQLQALAESKLYLAGRMMFQDDVSLQLKKPVLGFNVVDINQSEPRFKRWINVCTLIS